MSSVGFTKPFEANELRWYKDHQDQVWYVNSKHRIYCRKKVPGQLKNLVDFIRVVKHLSEVIKMNKHLYQGKDSLRSKHTLELISKEVIGQAIKIQQSLDKKPRWKVLIVKILVWLQTRTTLSDSMSNFTQQIIRLNLDVPLARWQYPQLIQDAKEALGSLESYKEVAKRYKLPPKANLNVLFNYVRNPMIFFLRNKISHHWHKAYSLIAQGKNWEDREVLFHAHLAMELVCLTHELVMKHELTWASQAKNKSKERMMIDQGEACVWMHYLLIGLYFWLRHMPTCQKGKEWTSRFVDQGSDCPFYQSDRIQEGWRQAFNREIKSWLQKVDINEVLRLDGRFFINLDIPNQPFGKHLNLDQLHELIKDTKELGSY